MNDTGISFGTVKNVIDDNVRVARRLKEISNGAGVKNKELQISKSGFSEAPPQCSSTRCSDRSKNKTMQSAVVPDPLQTPLTAFFFFRLMTRHVTAMPSRRTSLKLLFGMTYKKNSVFA